jgi:Acetyltransferase (GNAT) domain
MIDWAQNKKEYRKFCEQHAEMPVFLQDWWLDVVCTKGDWNVCLAKNKNNEINGILPFYLSRYFGFKVIKMPDLTPYCGIWLNYPGYLNEYSKNSFEKKVIGDLINQLPGTAYYTQNHPVQLTNWLPYYWKGFKQTTRFTYQIKNLIDLDFININIKNNTRNEILKAKKVLKVTETEDLELFYRINKLTFDRQSKQVPYTLHFLETLDKVLTNKNQRKIFVAKDNLENYHAVIYLIWDDKTVYNWLLGADSKHRKSGAVQLLLWEGIRFAAFKNCNFDFEGSMMPKVEPVFCRFGGKLTPYHKIYKGGNGLFQFLSGIINF